MARVLSKDHFPFSDTYAIVPINSQVFRDMYKKVAAGARVYSSIMRVPALLLLGAAAVASASTTYHGYKMVGVRPNTQEDVDFVSTLIQVLSLDEWTNRRGPGLTTDLLVPPTNVAPLLNALKSRRIAAAIKIEDVQALINRQMSEQSTSRSVPRAFDHTKYHTIDEIYAILDDLETNSAIASTYTAGTTYEGRPLRVTKVSSEGSGKQAIWIDCGIHAREWVSSATCQYILDQLTSGHSKGDAKVKALLDKYEFHILTSSNPDGYEYTWKHERLWRKNRVPYGILGCHGTDPNRNFDSAFGGPGTSNSPCSDIYHGPSAFSEKESQAIRDSILALKDVKMFFTIHSYSQLWMTPYGYTESLPENYYEQDRVAGVGVEALRAVYGTNYVHGNIANVIYMAAGGSSDWAYDSAGIQYSYALELRDQGTYGFLLPPEQILPTGEETWAGIMAAIEAAK